jgi:hypothetical protein
MNVIFFSTSIINHVLCKHPYFGQLTYWNCLFNLKRWIIHPPINLYNLFTLLLTTWTILISETILCGFHVVDVLKFCLTKNSKKIPLKVALQKKLIDISNIKISKNHHTKCIAFQAHPNKLDSKIVSTLFVINFKRNFEFWI